MKAAQDIRPEDAVDVIDQIDVEMAVVHAAPKDRAVLRHCENTAAVLDQLAEVLAMVILGRRQHLLVKTVEQRIGESEYSTANHRATKHASGKLPTGRF